MSNQSEHGQSIYWRPEKINLPDYLQSGKILDTPRKEAGRDCSALEIAESAVEAVSNKFQQLQQVHANRSPEQTPLAHFKKTSTLAESTGKKSRQILADTQANLSKKKIQIESTIADRLGLHETSHADEIRRVVREMPENERYSFIQDAITSGDNQLMGAVLNGHPALTGLSKKSIQAFKQQYFNQHAKEDLQHIRAIDHAQQRISKQMDCVVESEAAFGKIPTALAEEAAKADEAYAQAQKWGV